MQVKIGRQTRALRTVWFEAERNAVVMIDQRRLPHEVRLLTLRDHRATARAIRDMAVRGAGAIGATAAYGLAQGIAEWRGGGGAAFAAHVESVYETLATARPTAVDPVNAMRAMRAQLAGRRGVAAWRSAARRLAEAFAEEDVAHCRAIGTHGLELVREGMNLLTHCNAGWLAFVDIGSATAPMYAAQAVGRRFHVFCDETRPRCQGASLTAWELAQQGIPHTVIADNAAGWLMRQGRIDLVITGADRVLGRTGAAANKIGTYTKAVLAQRHGLPFYVAIPLSTIDWELRGEVEIPIEERSGDEVLHAWGADETGRRRRVRVANPSSGAVNPGFDVTPPELITGFITPLGIFKPQDLWTNRRKLGGPA